MTMKRSRKVKKVAVNETVEAKIPQSAPEMPKEKEKEPEWIRIYFSDGRIYKIAYQHLKKEVEARFGLAGAVTVAYVLADCGKIPWAVFQASAIQVMREHLDNEEVAWTTSRKEIVIL